MNHITAKTISALFGITFFSVGILGYFPNPIVSAEGLFAVNALHNWVHILTGAGFLTGAVLSETAAQRILRWIAIAYVGVAVLGFFTEGAYLLGLIHINEPDKWLHAGLALVILTASGRIARKSPINQPA